ncbi:hypothetical protein ACFE04_009755 [Oxalis oulophora]
MWSSSSSLRQAAALRQQGYYRYFRYVAAPTFYAKVDTLTNIPPYVNTTGTIINCSEQSNHEEYVGQPSFYNTPFGGNRYFCSQTGNNNEVDDGSENGNIKEEGGDEDEFLDSESLGDGGKEPEWREAHEKLLTRLLDCRGAITSVLDKWIEEGNEFDQNGISLISYRLRKCRAYLKALQFSEWLEANKHIDLTEKDFSLRLDMIARTQGLLRAEKYFENIPVSFKGEFVYRTFIARCVFALNMKKAEELFEKMKVSKLPCTIDTCNQMIILYKRLDSRKITGLLLLMQKENIEPSLLTLKLLMDIKGESKDIVGMEETYEKMLAKNIQPDLGALVILAKHYISAGFKDKAANILNEIEKQNLKDTYGARTALLRINASLGNNDKVSKIWEECKVDPTMDEIVAAIEAWGKLGKVEEAEAVFEKIPVRFNKFSSRHYTALLKVYAEHKKETKGKDLMKKMALSGCRVGPLTWDALVRLFVESGNVKKAERVLNNAAEQKQRPLFNSYIIMMEVFAKQGDIHNTEKWLCKMRDVGYTGRIKPFQVLVEAYINANTPAYGIRDRMKAEKLVPNRALSEKLALVDVFRKTSISHVMD